MSEALCLSLLLMNEKASYLRYGEYPNVNKSRLCYLSMLYELYENGGVERLTQPLAFGSSVEPFGIWVRLSRGHCRSMLGEGFVSNDLASMFCIRPSMTPPL